MNPSPNLPHQSSSPPDPMPLKPETTTPSSHTSAQNNAELDRESSKASLENAPVLRKPPVRPVRPQSPAQSSGATSLEKSSGQPPAKPDNAVTSTSAKLEIVSVSSPTPPTPPQSVPTPPPSDTPPKDSVAQATLRQQPIPPPSEPKQYRAIGLVRGFYTPSEEEFTRGDFKAVDDSLLKAVLLGRVMSLVKNHIDLEKEHLWVVYPRTREEQKELHLQIVGVWEPETLKKDELNEDEDEVDKAASSDPASLDVEIDYFSVRGEVVFCSPDEKIVVVKIQQTPRKNSQKAKAFKLTLQGELEGTRTVGYFWDLHIKRQDNALLVTSGTCVGMAPPKKRDKELVNKNRSRKPSFNRTGKPSVAGGRSPRSASPIPTKEGAPSKPIKRSEQKPPSEG